MAARLERAQSHIHAIAAATSEQRVAAALVMLAERTGTPRKGSILLDVPLSRDDLASLTGTVSETVSRVLAQLRRDRSEEHTSELQSLMRISYAVFCLQKKKRKMNHTS